MRQARALALAVIVTALPGCTALAPYPTSPRIAGPGEEATALRVAICYDTLVSSPDEIHLAAQQECPADTTAQYFETDWHLQYCPLLLPARATFVCEAKK